MRAQRSTQLEFSCCVGCLRTCGGCFRVFRYNMQCCSACCRGRPLATVLQRVRDVRVHSIVSTYSPTACLGCSFRRPRLKKSRKNICIPRFHCQKARHVRNKAFSDFFGTVPPPAISVNMCTKQPKTHKEKVSFLSVVARQDLKNCGGRTL